MSTSTQTPAARGKAPIYKRRRRRIYGAAAAAALVVIALIIWAVTAKSGFIPPWYWQWCFPPA